jgi:hypothetical protein
VSDDYDPVAIEMNYMLRRGRWEDELRALIEAGPLKGLPDWEWIGLYDADADDVDWWDPEEAYDALLAQKSMTDPSRIKPEPYWDRGDLDAMDAETFPDGWPG